MTVVSSASGILAMLQEDQVPLKVFALKNLNLLVGQFWAEISAHISTIESLYEDEEFEHRELAALLASKVFYHLGELNDSLAYALGAGSFFDVSEDSEYVQTLIAKCIDEYVEQNSKQFDKANLLRDVETQKEEDVSESGVDPRLVAVVEKMLDKCIAEGHYQQAIGIALECRRLDKLKETVRASGNSPVLLTYCLRAAQTLIHRREFRQQVLKVLVELCERVEAPDFVSICHCLMFLEDASEVASILDRLLKGSKDDALLAYQVAFDLFENEFQQFLINVRHRLPEAPVARSVPPQTSAHASEVSPEPTPLPAGTDPPAALREGAEANKEGPSAMDVEADGSQPGPRDGDGVEGSSGKTEGPPAVAGGAVTEGEKKEGDSEMEGEVGAAATPVVPSVVEEVALTPEEIEYSDRLSKLKSILSGETPINLSLQFLYTHNKSDLAILKATKTAVESRNSVCHSATIFANAIMHAGTTVDTFLRENLDWLSRATNWAKFSAIAGLGVIHRGHLQQGRSLMAPYLPQNGASGSPFSEGGALYALGLIHTNHGEGIKNFLLESLRNTGNETIQHGACLGLGLAAMGTGDEEVYEDVKSVLYTDSAVAGEAAGIAMGLLMVGSASERAGEMLAYAHDTQHEKIIRGLALGIALVVYGREEEADTLIEQMVRDQDPILRYGGMYAIAMAYRGTANNKAIRQLLHFAVSDVSDDVRRAAVLALGFVLCSEPEQVPKIVSLLAESYNPHVRYGAAMAVGIACAGTGLRGALDLLEPLTSDVTDFVRQGAFIATAMVLLQTTSAREPRVASFRKQLEKVVADKHEDVLAKMGAIIATGILDAGGRNVTISLRSRSGHDRVAAVVGMAVFTQFWCWFPLTYFVSLCFVPTAFIGIQEDLKVPKFEFVSECKPSLFEYPAPISAPSSHLAAKAPVAVLSTSARAKSRSKKDAETKSGAIAAEKKDKAGGDVEMAAEELNKANGDKMEVEGEATAPEKEPEPASETLVNPARVVPAQEKFIKLPEGGRYASIGKTLAGFVVLKDLKPELPQEFALTDGPAGPSGSIAGTGGAGGGAGGNLGGSGEARGGRGGSRAPPTASDDEPPPPDEFDFSS